MTLENGEVLQNLTNQLQEVTQQLNQLTETRVKLIGAIEVLQQIEETKDSLRRNKRTVWHINTASFKDAHFAVYPPDLIESPIDACCPEFVDKKTGKPRERVIEKTQGKVTTYDDKGYDDKRDNSEFKPGIVLDPFFGSGTTAQVAMSQDKDWVGIELNSEYEKIFEKRLKPKIVEKKTRDKASKFWDIK